MGMSSIDCLRRMQKNIRSIYTMANQPNTSWMAAIRREMLSPTPLRIINDAIYRPGLYRLTNDGNRTERRTQYDRDQNDQESWDLSWAMD